MLEIADFARTQLANLLTSLKRLSRMSEIADFAKYHPQYLYDSRTCSSIFFIIPVWIRILFGIRSDSRLH